MKCDEFQDRLYDMSAEEDITGEMREHISGCKECAERFEAYRSLIPRAEPQAPETLTGRVMARAAEKRVKRRTVGGSGRAWYAAAAVVVAATAIVAAIVAKPNQASAAVAMLDDAVANTDSIRSMVVKMEVRTLPEENFSYIGLNEEMVPHILTVLTGDSYRWKLEKEGRAAMCDGSSKYMWLPAQNYGYAGSVNSCFEEWFSLLIDPSLILYKEKEAAMRHKGVRYTIREEGPRLLMTVEAKAMGDFTNNYMLNTSIEESDTRREYIFDRESKLLKGLRIFAADGGREVLVLDIKEIEYNVPVDGKELISLPAECEWRDLTAAPPAGILSGISAQDAAKLLFASLERGELDAVAKELLYTYDTGPILKIYSGARLKSIGAPFKSGLYAGWFVPCEIKLATGKVKRFNLALRNDNPNRVWMVDGGL